MADIKEISSTQSKISLHEVWFLSSKLRILCIGNVVGTILYRSKNQESSSDMFEGKGERYWLSCVQFGQTDENRKIESSIELDRVLTVDWLMPTTVCIISRQSTPKFAFAEKGMLVYIDTLLLILFPLFWRKYSFHSV